MTNQNEEQFRYITTLFYSGLYQDGIPQISKLIDQYPHNSMLYINRALFYSQLGEDLAAMDDLEQAIKVDPYNYIAYFNLFSVLARNSQDLEAYHQLTCSLSCMYLLKAKATKDVRFAQKSLEYSSNNIAARLLKECIELGSKVGQKWAACDGQNNQLISLLQDNKKQEFFQKVEAMSGVISNCKLESSAAICQKADILEQINSKVKQFNGLYVELNNRFGAITQKVPKESQLHSNIDSYLRERSKTSTSNRQSVIAILQDDQYFNGPKKQSERQNELQETNPESLQQIQKEQQKEDKLPPRQLDVDRYEHKQANSFQSINKVSSVIEERSLEYEDERLTSPISEQAQTHNHLIYPLNAKKLLKISILSFCFLQTPQVLPNNAYCVVAYNRQVRFISSSVRCQESSCVWNQGCGAFALSAQPALMMLKIYNKNFQALKDELIGEIQVLIDIADLLRLPIYNVEGEPVGRILLHLQLYEQQGHLMIDDKI